MERLKELIYVFTCVTTGVFLATTIFTSIFYHNSVMGGDLLWQMLIVDVFCCFGNFLYPISRKLTKTSFYLRVLTHYLYINVVTIGFGLYFTWFFADNIYMMLTMVLLVAVVFIVVASSMRYRSCHLADEMNSRLQQYQKLHVLDEE